MRNIVTGLAVLAVAIVVAGCQTAPKTDTEKDELVSNAGATIKEFKQVDSTIGDFFDSAKGWAVFPTIGKGGLGVGGAYGKGVLYAGGKMIGYCDLSQGSIGLQIGGQGYSEIIFFQTAGALDSFKAGEFAFSAQATGVAVKAGAAATADYSNGVAVFTKPKGGLMGEASIGGQNFSFVAK
ncbi:MAG: lipid-binding SYLF domain-containing protein [Planctomycetota bacterium]|jgi:lipid-binding SYLF domain-containing protein